MATASGVSFSNYGRSISAGAATAAARSTSSVKTQSVGRSSTASSTATASSTSGAASSASKASTGSYSVNWSTVGASVQLAGNLYSTFNSYNASKAAAASYAQQAKDVLTEANTQVLFEKLNNNITQNAYASDRLELLRMQREEMGALRTAFSGEGLEMTGSALNVMAEQGAAHARDLDQLDKNAQMSAFKSQLNSENILLTANYKSRALEIQAKYAKKAARNQLVAGLLSSVGSFAYGIGSAK